MTYRGLGMVATAAPSCSGETAGPRNRGTVVDEGKNGPDRFEPRSCVRPSPQWRDFAAGQHKTPARQRLRTDPLARGQHRQVGVVVETAKPVQPPPRPDVVTIRLLRRHWGSSEVTLPGQREQERRQRRTPQTGRRVRFGPARNGDRECRERPPMAHTITVSCRVTHDVTPRRTPPAPPATPARYATVRQR